MKQRFSSLDLQIISSELRQTVVGHRVSNIYDLSARIFLFKFALPNSKHLVVVDSGFRVHLTSFTRETSPTPSGFVAKLRKHLRTRRITNITQLGVDRVLDLEFSDGLYHLYLEFFAGGNVILTDRDRKILAVLRIVSGDAEGKGDCRVGATYDAAGRELPEGVTMDRLLEVLKTPEEPQQQEDAGAAKTKKGKFQKKKKKSDDSLKKVLGAKMPEFSPVLVEHALRGAGIDPTVSRDDVLVTEELLEKVVEALQEAGKILKSLTSGEGVNMGYIIAKLPRDKTAPADEKDNEPRGVPEEKKGVSFAGSEAVERDVVEKVQDDGEAKGLVFDDFHPFLPKQFVDVPGLKTLEYEGFNKTVDTFFSSIESQKLESRLKDREETAAKRLTAAREDHKKRVGALQDVQTLNIRKAEALMANQYRVEEVMGAVGSLVAGGMDWVNIARLIQLEQKRKNPVSEMISLPLKLFENKITILLEEVDWDAVNDGNDSDYGESSEEEDSEHEDAQKMPEKDMLRIDVDLGLTVFANARQYYDQKRSAAEKETKTLKSSTKALKSTEKKIAADLKKTLKTEKQIMRPVRKPMWFEKFLFFISSDGYLVLGGRDAQQNEHLYKRHLRRGDVYVHADIQGAATVIVKNNPSTPSAPIPPGTLQQAGQLSVCTSQAWDSKAVLAAWWVSHDQVSKTAPTGEYMDPGMFNIRGRKNFLPPGQLILGYGVIWRVDEESKKKHVKHRVDEEKTEDTGPEEAEEGNAEPDAKAGEEKQEDEQDEDSDEEFPDAKVESADEAEDDGEDEESGEDFPDTKIDFEEDKPEDKPEEPGAEAEEPGAEAEEPKVEKSTAQLGKYNLEDLSKALPSYPTPPAAGNGPRHLSAKQRRDLKKGRPFTPGTSSAATPTGSRTSTPAPSSATPSKALPRGKRAKAKRAAAKYAFQDEDDRLLAAVLIGAGPATGAASTDAPEEESTPKETPDERKARLRAQHQRTQAVGLAAEAKRHAALAEDNDDAEEEHEIATTPLDSFVPDPRPDDVILDAIPVCAPWGAMGRYKWRVKMQPGAQKKGKAIREVWHAWSADGRKGGMAGKEKELVQGWREAEIVNCVGVSKVKVFSSAGGGGDAKNGGGGKGGAKGKGGPKKGGKRK